MAEHQYRSRPVVIEAFQMTEERINSNMDWPSWLHEAWNLEPREVGSVYLHHTEPRRLAVMTLEGSRLLETDYWIIKGTKGVLYPCDPEIFAEKYEEV